MASFFDFAACGCNRDATKPAPAKEEDEEDEYSYVSEEGADIDLDHLSPGAQAAVNDEFQKVNEDILKLKKEGVHRSDENMKALLCRRNALEEQMAEIKKVGEKRECPKADVPVEYTWDTNEEKLGIRLQDTSRHGVLVSFIAPDAANDLPNLIGMRVMTIQGDDVTKLNVAHCVENIKGSKYPLTIKFQCSKELFTLIDANNDGDITRKEFVTYASKNATEPEIISPMNQPGARTTPQ